MSSFRSISTIAAAAIGLLACTEDEVPTFKVATDDMVRNPMAQEAVNAPSKTPPLRWKAPEEWVEEEPGQFQISLYRLGPDALVSVSKLSREAGGMKANVNRWRQQIGLEPGDELGGETLVFEEGESRGRWFELSGERESILAAVIPMENETWFFKLRSQNGQLETTRSQFTGFLNSVQIGSERTESEKPGINLETPEGWEKIEATGMRIASFRIPESGGIDGDVSVISSLGKVGTTLEHVNLWRAQLRLPALESGDEPALGEILEGSSGPITMTHMVSDVALFSNNRHGAISTAILKVGEVTWFFKMAGLADQVARNREKFETFVRSAEFP